ncbi:MAG TPA: hypothetical protein VKU00_17090 [Chthonomonadaceae bacterium]|nr:hypothetical protein [Chthonomonadaceae bacterium]
MALDEALLEAASTGAALPTLRLYHWARPAITVGRFQNVGKTICMEACREQGIPLVRRITGGRGILHGDDLTLGLTAPLEALGLAGDSACSPAALYARIAPGFARAFAAMGQQAERGVDRAERALGAQGDCFATAGCADLIAPMTGCKLLGAALHRRDRWILLQASIPYRLSKESAAKRRELFCGPVAEPGLNADLDPEALAGAIVNGLGEWLAISWLRGAISGQEERRGKDLARMQYAGAHLD